MAMTEQDKKQDSKMMSIYMGIVVGIVVAYLLAYAFALSDNLVSGIMSVIDKVTQGSLLFQPRVQSVIGILIGIVVGGLTGFMSWADYLKRAHYTDTAVAGTGGFMTKKDLKEYADKYIFPDPPALDKNLPVAYDPEKDTKMYSQNMIMSNHFSRPINSRRLIGNNNVLIVGGAGTGKSRFFIKPNMLQMNASFVITDPSGEMIYSLGSVLKNHGYKIKIFNISDMSHSNCYNPLNYIRDDAGVDMLIECLINNTTKGEGGGDNQFFVDAEKLLYSACIHYMIDFERDGSKKNFAGIMSMINASSVNEMDPNAKSPVDMLFDQLPRNSLAWKNYKAFKQAAGKTLKSIIISCVTRLRPFLTPQVVNLTKYDNLNLEKIGDEKTALFIITPQADRTYAFLASMLYSQLFETLYHRAEQKKAETGDERLAIPVRCLMDEFANIGEVPEFPSKLATMRKYNISATVVLQDISQIESMYKDDWKTLVGNCSSIVFLGTQEPNTLKYFSDMLGKMTVRSKSNNLSGGKGGSSEGYQNTGREVMTADELGRLPSDECIVFTQNMRPVRDKKYKYERHPYYPQTADADEKNCFQYAKLSVYNNTKLGCNGSLFKARAEAARIRWEEQKSATTIKSTDDVMIKRTSADVMDVISLGPEEEKKRYRQLVEDAIMQVLDHMTDPVCFITTRGLRWKDMPGFIAQISARTHKSSLVLFNDTTVSDDDIYIPGLALDRDRTGLFEKLKTRYTKNIVEKGEYTVMKISKYVIPQFEEEVFKNLAKSEQ